MTVKLLIEQHFEFLSLLGGCTDSYESIHVKAPHCYKSHVAAQMLLPDKYFKPPHNLVAPAAVSSKAEVLLCCCEYFIPCCSHCVEVFVFSFDCIIFNE